MKKLTKRNISPDYQRIPHFNRDISNMTHDDIELEVPMEFPFECFVQEKIDGANFGVSWNDGPIVRNKEHILKKGYSKIKTPAKKQFTSSWNWIHSHKEDIERVEKKWESKITIYGEYMYAKHSIEYNKLPDVFIAYDIWSVDDNKYLAPDIVENLLKDTNIKYIKPVKRIFNSIDEIIKESEKESEYRDGIVEGIVLKMSDKFFCTNVFKVVNKYFKRRDDFNKELIKNRYISNI